MLLAGNQLWSASTGFNADPQFSCYYNGNAYYTVAVQQVVQLQELTAPTHTSGTVSDGAITWT